MPGTICRSDLPLSLAPPVGRQVHAGTRRHSRFCVMQTLAKRRGKEGTAHEGSPDIRARMNCKNHYNTNTGALIAWSDYKIRMAVMLSSQLALKVFVESLLFRLQMLLLLQMIPFYYRLKLFQPTTQQALEMARLWMLSLSLFALSFSSAMNKHANTKTLPTFQRFIFKKGALCSFGGGGFIRRLRSSLTDIFYASSN